MEGFKEQELPKKGSRIKLIADIITGIVFGGLVTMGLIYMIRLLLLKP